MKTLMLLGLLLVVAACAPAQPQLAWTGPHLDQFPRDRYECTRDANAGGSYVALPMLNTTLPTMSPPRPWVHVPDWALFQQCMESKGYWLVPVATPNSRTPE